jgi:hypothetical protein
MNCKWCGQPKDNVSVYENTFQQFPKGQYVKLCPDCYRILKDLQGHIKLTISCEGDRSVGIWGEDTTILIDKKFISGDYGDAPDCRKWIRDKVADLFKELFDDNRTRACFEDECWECSNLKTECKCGDGSLV